MCRKSTSPVVTNLYTFDICVKEAMSWVGKVDNTASVSVGWPLSKIQNPPRYYNGVEGAFG